MSPNVESPVTLRRCQKDKGRGRKERKKKQQQTNKQTNKQTKNQKTPPKRSCFLQGVTEMNAMTAVENSIYDKGPLGASSD